MSVETQLDLRPSVRESPPRKTYPSSVEPPIHFLLELDPEVVKWRRRTMFLTSVFAHILLILLLTNGACITPARRDYATVDRSASERLNALVFGLTPAADSHRFVASAVLGSAMGAGFVDRVIGPLANGSAIKDTEVAAKAFELLEKAGQQFRRDGKLMENSEANIAEISTLVREFRDTRLPLWRSLGIVAS